MSGSRDSAHAYVAYGRRDRAYSAMMARVAAHLGRHAQIRRRACNLRQADLAGHLGVSRQWVIALEQGRAGLDLDLVLRAYEALGLGLRMENLRDAMPDWADALQKERELIVRPARRPRKRRCRDYLDALHARAEQDRARAKRQKGCLDSIDRDRPVD